MGVRCSQKIAITIRTKRRITRDAKLSILDTYHEIVYCQYFDNIRLYRFNELIKHNIFLR
jgi:hypothetical protein